MAYQLELRHVRYFLAVAEDLHFRKAAERLYISQPGLSRQIRDMEEGMGIVLFERHNRKVALTEAGVYLKEELQRSLSNLDRIVDHGRSIHQGKEGMIHLGYVGSAMQKIIPNLLVSFRESYPNVVFNLKEMDNGKQIEKLLSHEIDLGFVRMERLPRGVKSKAILIEDFCLVLPNDHQLNSESFEGLGQLREEPFILFDPEYSPSYYEKVMQIFDDSGFSPLLSHSTVHASSIFKLVENKMGVSIVPHSIRQDHYPGIKFIELKDIKQRTILSAIWNKDNANPTLAKLVGML